MTRPGLHSIDELKDMLTSQVEAVAYHYAPPCAESYEDKGTYWTLNPGRADRRVGSFCVHLRGAHIGRFKDYSSGDRGDLLDLIKLHLGCSNVEALKEARRFLGLATESPDDKRRRERRMEDMKRKRAEAEKQDRIDAKKRAKSAHALWLSGQVKIAGTPVDHYLRGRGIDLSRLGRQPGAIRYLPKCYYRHIDKETGEVIEGECPAMGAIAVDKTGAATACHRTYLGLSSSGWVKADMPEAKKVLGAYQGSYISLWRGIGPRGGKPSSLPKAPPGTRVFVTEGIEDALSAVTLIPEARVLAAISLDNLSRLKLPRNVDEVVLIGDRDPHPEAQAALDRAITTLGSQGRRVRLWQNDLGGKDLNDALKAQQERAADERAAS